MYAAPDFSQVPPKNTPICAGLALAAQGDVMMTVEALLPQFRAMCRKFYVTHPDVAHPIAAYHWMNRELISRFGIPATLQHAHAIDARLRTAQRGAWLSLGVAR